jgi:hypothetical protein
MSNITYETLFVREQTKQQRKTSGSYPKDKLFIDLKEIIKILIFS